MKMLHLIFFLVLLFPSAALASNLKVGHFNLQTVVSQSQAGRDARAIYLEKAQEFQDEINQRTATLSELKEEISKGIESLKEGEKVPTEILEKDAQAAELFRELRRLQIGYQDELKLADGQMTRAVVLQLRPVLAEFAEKNKYDYLFRLGEGFAYANNKRDVTNELIEAFDKAMSK